MRPALAAILVLGLAAVLSASLPDFVRQSVPDYAEQGYVGHEACRACHVELYDRWAASAHARSTAPATPANLPPEMVRGERVEHAPSWSQFHREGDQVYVTTTGPEGTPRRYPVTHVVGPKRVSFFLTRMEDGRLQVLPSMYEVTTGKWFDYTQLIFGVPGVPYTEAPVVRPGEPSFWTGPIRSYDRTCGRCHTSGRRERLPEEPGLAWDPLPVDCEACHGPGKAHVEFWRNPPEKWAPDPLLDLSRLPRDRAQSVCLWCHMEAEVVRPDWRPGEDVFEALSPTLLDNVERVDAAGRPLELIYDGIPFLASPCAEAGKLNCVYCHDAHGTKHTADLVVPPDRTDSLCTACHLDIAADARAHAHHDLTKSGGQCVACHMPYLTIERGHGIVRDHTLGSPLLDLYGGRVAVDACTWCHTGGRGAPDDAPRLSPEEIRKAWKDWYPGAALRPSWVKAIAGGRAGEASALYPLVKVAADRGLPRYVRASAARLLGPYGSSALVYLMDFATDEDSLVRRAAAAALGGLVHEDADLTLRRLLEDPSLAVRGAAARAALAGYTRVQDNPRLLAAVIPVLAEEAEVVPQEDQRWFRLGAAREIAGDNAGALAAYERKLALDPYARLVRDAADALRKRLAGR